MWRKRREFLAHEEEYHEGWSILAVQRIRGSLAFRGWKIWNGTGYCGFRGTDAIGIGSANRMRASAQCQCSGADSHFPCF